MQQPQLHKYGERSGVTRRNALKTSGDLTSTGYCQKFYEEHEEPFSNIRKGKGNPPLELILTHKWGCWAQGGNMGKRATISLKIRNPNVEIPAFAEATSRRQAKQWPKFESQMTETCSFYCDVSNLEHLKFGFVSNFVLRYSNFHPFDTQTTNEPLCPAP